MLSREDKAHYIREKRRAQTFQKVRDYEASKGLFR